MFDGTNVEYSYDGSFDGLLCCVFESFDKKEVPCAIYSPSHTQVGFIKPKEIVTDSEKARRVLVSVPGIHPEAMDFIRKAFLTCLENKEVYILEFLRMGYRLGSKVMYMLADETVSVLSKAVGHLEREAHLYLGFVRFSVFGNAMVAEIEPKNFVLPLMVNHFCGRYPNENFLIYDKTHGVALVYEPFKYRIVPIENLVKPEPDEEEMRCRKLWQMFYDTIEIEGRHNPKCRMGLMPKRYWAEMTEFQR